MSGDIERGDAHGGHGVLEQRDEPVGSELIKSVGTAKAGNADRCIGIAEGSERRGRIVEETRLRGGSASSHDLIVHLSTLTGPALIAG